MERRANQADAPPGSAVDEPAASPHHVIEKLEASARSA
jgi:hypothetical protein